MAGMYTVITFLLPLFLLPGNGEAKYKTVSTCKGVQKMLKDEATNTGPLKVAAFNIKHFGRNKMSKEIVACRIVEILQRYDVILIQETRDKSGIALNDLWRLLNETGNEWGMLRSERIGRSSYKEQYVYAYRLSRARLTGSYQVSDAKDAYEREPFCAEFEYTSVTQGTAKRVTLVGLHAKPTDAPKELELLARDIKVVAKHFSLSGGVLALGDFNADCSYANAKERASLDIFKTELGFTSLIPDDADTTTSDTNCAYDRIVAYGSDIIAHNASVYDFEVAMELSAKDGYAISDHYPVEVQLY